MTDDLQGHSEKVNESIFVCSIYMESLDSRSIHW